VETEKFFSLVVFNYLFSNGDAHLKNFALNKGLFADDFRSPLFKRTHHPAKEDFMVFAERIGIVAKRAQKLLAPFLETPEKLNTLIERSFLDEPTKKSFQVNYNTRKNFLSREQ